MKTSGRGLHWQSSTGEYELQRCSWMLAKECTKIREAYNKGGEEIGDRPVVRSGDSLRILQFEFGDCPQISRPVSPRFTPKFFVVCVRDRNPPKMRGYRLSEFKERKHERYSFGPDGGAR